MGDNSVDTTAGETTYTYPIPRSVPTDPPAEYGTLRAARPVCPIKLATGDSAIIVTRYEDIKTVLSDTRFSREALFRPGMARAQIIEPDPDSLLSMDPPRHTRIRALANKEFSRRRVEQMRPQIKLLVDELLDQMATMTPPVDLNACFSRPLALRIICDLLGVPVEDSDKFGFWCEHFMSLTKFTAEQMTRANTDMRAYFVELIASKRANPGSDLLSALVDAHDDEGKITESELVSLAVLLLLAGHDTTVTVMGGIVATLLRNPEQLELLRSDLGQLPAAMEELIRLNTPGDGSFIRIATTDVTLSDVLIPAGSAVIAPISAGDRDGSVFAEPDTCELFREDNPHIGFGYGTHFCIGSILARAELEIGLGGLISRFPGLRLAVRLEELQWKQFAALGGWESFPVTWD